MPDFRLKVFYSAAKNLSFTKAAQDLFISQPAVTRHIKNLEDQYQALLFERQGNKLVLTEAGDLLLHHAERILQEYHSLQYEMHLLHNDHVGQLRMGASTTIAQYVLPPYLATFVEDFPHADISMLNGNSRFIERSLDERTIDLGLIEGITRLPMFTYTPFLEDELTILTAAKNKIGINGNLSIDEFKRLPLVLRERGSGTLDAIEQSLLEHGIKLTELNIRIYLGNTEAIKLFTQNSESLCILSKHAVAKEVNQGLLRPLRVPGLKFTRSLCFVQAPGPQQALALRFMDYVKKEALKATPITF